MPISEKSNNPKIPAVKGEDTGEQGFGVHGISKSGHGVHGDSKTSQGVVGISEGFHGVFGHSKSDVGVAGESESMIGVLGVSKNSRGTGVVGDCVVAGGFGVIGRGLIGVTGESTGGLQGLGVLGSSPGGDGVVGRGHRGVRGESDEYQGVSGHSKRNVGVFGESEELSGVYAISHHPQNAGIYATNDRGGRAAFFQGDVEVTGDIRLTNGDCAEDFDVSGAEKVEPGTVMVLGNEGALSESQQAYDKRVAGVISGAGDYKPGIVLDKQQTSGNRQPVALMGKVFCKVDAQFGAIEVGDLLTTSPTPGHAMKTRDPLKAFGAVIGKALRPLSEGQGLIPILIALQ